MSVNLTGLIKGKQNYVFLLYACISIIITARKVIGRRMSV